MDFAALELWLNAHEELIIVVIAATAFVESLALIGIIVPGIALLFAAGSAAGSTDISLAWVLGAAFVGSVTGDGISFLLGYHYHNWMRKMPPFNKHPEWIERGERFFEQYGLMSIILGRFIGPLRPIMPLVAGAMQMRPIQFFSINILSAFAWAPFYLMPGYIVGASLNSSNALGGRHAVFLLTVLLVGWLIAQALWWAYQNIHLRRNKIQLALSLSILCATLFFMLSQLMQLSSVQWINQTMALWAITLRHPWLDPFFIAITQLGFFAPMTLWAILVAAALLWQKNYYCLSLWLGTVIFSMLTLNILKTLFAWDRPHLINTIPESFAFPSGHTLSSMVFFGSLAILLLPGISPRRQKVFLSSAGVAVAIVASSRIYLTVHWITDVIGGLLLGGMFLGVLYTIVLKHPFPIVRPKSVLMACLLAWIISLGYWGIPSLTTHIKHYAPLHLTAPNNE